MARSVSGSSPRVAGASGRSLRLALVAAATLAALLPGGAWALFNDRVELWAAENITYDSNVFRISDKVGPAGIGDTQLDDTILSTHVGVTANIPWSQQRFEGAVTWYRTKYRHFKDLDYDGHTARAVWNYSFMHRLTGTLGASETEGLASFSNIQGRLPDLVTVRHGFFTGAWLMTPRWRWNTALNAVETRHSEETRRVNNIETHAGEIGLSYITPLDNSFGGYVRGERGRIPEGVTLAGLPFDNEYKQLGMGAMMTWVVTGHSRFDGRVEWVKRSYEEASQRDFSGFTTRMAYTWTPTGKTTVEAAVQRVVGPAEDIQTAFVLVTGGYIRPRWNATDKITVQGNLEYNVWDYRGETNPLSPGLGQNFEHRQTLFGASVLWRPWQRVLVHTGINREIRKSSLPTGDYETTVGFIEGRIGF
jgi:exopolysaccharide biosynthesis operon protein EpsL